MDYKKFDDIESLNFIAQPDNLRVQQRTSTINGPELLKQCGGILMATPFIKAGALMFASGFALDVMEFTIDVIDRVSAKEEYQKCKHELNRRIENAEINETRKVAADMSKMTGGVIPLLSKNPEAAAVLRGVGLLLHNTGFAIEENPTKGDLLKQIGGNAMSFGALAAKKHPTTSMILRVFGVGSHHIGFEMDKLTRPVEIKEKYLECKECIDELFANINVNHVSKGENNEICK
jgi:hypothetical protein